MPPRMDKFPSEGLEGALSKDIGWHSGNPVPNARGHVICKLCGKVTKGGITRFKEHIAHKGGEVLACPNVTEDDEFFDDVSAMRQATRESIQSQHEWHRREEFRRSTGGWGNVYEEGRSSSHGSVRGHRGERSIPNESEFNLRIAIPELVKSKSLRQPKVEWIQEKENPLLDGENAGLFPVDSSDDEINVVDQSEEQNLSDSSSSATPTQSGGDGQDSGIGDLSPIYDDDRESGDRGEIRSSHRHGEEYGIGSAGGRFRLMSEFGGNMSATPSDSRERSESRARSKEKGKGTKKHTSEGSSRRRSTSSNPGYTDSSTSTRDFYPPGSGQSSYS
ncbi:hypothetical protein V6N13_109825 [Hibiscus sabdariffa]